MRTILGVLTLSLVALAVPLTAPFVLADGEPAGDPGAVVPKTELRIVRTRRILGTLQAAYEKERDAATTDTVMLDRLEKAMADARELMKPVKPEELTEDERKELATALAPEAADKADEPEDGADPGNPFAGWQDRAIERVFEGADLTEADEAAAKPILADWFAKNAVARAGNDSKAQSDLKRERDDALEKALGKKKARKVINNANSAMGRGR